jgi:hypothetical protein
MDVFFVIILLLILYFTFGTSIKSSLEGVRDYSGNIPAMYFGLKDYNELLNRFVN